MSATIEHHENNTYILRVSGELKKSELDSVQAEFVQYILPAGEIRLLVLMENFTGWEEGGGWEDTAFFSSHGNGFEKIAVVGEPRWEAEVLAFTGAGMRKGPVKFFAQPDKEQALSWLAE